MLGGNFERKSSSGDRKAINMKNVELTQDFRNEKTSFMSAISTVRETAVRLHLSFATPR